MLIYGNGVKISTYVCGKYPVRPLTLPSYQFSSTRFNNWIVSFSCEFGSREENESFESIIRWHPGLLGYQEMNTKTTETHLETQFARIFRIEVVDSSTAWTRWTRWHRCFSRRTHRRWQWRSCKFKHFFVVIQIPFTINYMKDTLEACVSKYSTFSRISQFHAFDNISRFS